MRVVSSRTFTVVLLAVAGAVVPHELLACGHDCNPSPDPIEIGVLPGYQQSRVRQINNQGDIVGQAIRAGEEPTQQAVLWHKVRGPKLAPEVLPPLDGFVRGEARGFATFWIPVGISFIPGGGTQRAVAWKMDWAAGQRVAVDLEPPPGLTDAQAWSGNGLGLIAGDAWNPQDKVEGLLVRHAMLWWPTWGGTFKACDLGVPNGFLASSANDVNAFGMVAGTATGRSATGALINAVVVWRPAGPIWACQYEAVPLASDPSAPTVQAPAINEGGDVVARADGGSPPSSRALLWRRRGHRYSDPEFLPPPEGFDDALARSINSQGDIVGTAQKRSATGAVIETRVVLWRKARGGWTSRILMSPADTVRINSQHLNDRGDVIADTTVAPSDSSGAYLWESATQGSCRSGGLADNDGGDVRR